MGDAIWIPVVLLGIVGIFGSILWLAFRAARHYHPRDPGTLRDLERRSRWPDHRL